MRPQISWSDLAGARVGVWGLGVEGRANLRRLRSQGVAPVLVDDRPAPVSDSVSSDGPVPAAAGGLVLATAAGGLDALGHCEVVVKSPGISRYGADCRALVDAGVAVVGGLGLWLQEADRSRVLCLTGTKGKSTTTAIAGHLLGRWGYRTLVGGNIGVPPWDPALGTDYDWWLVEVSSYQATDVASSPPVTVVTSLHADHLTWHGDEEAYVRDKLSLCSQPGARVTVANGGDERLRSRAQLLAPEIRWIEPAGPVGPVGHEAGEDSWIDGLGLLGAHNRTNARIARAALAELGVPEASDSEALAGAATGFSGLASRLQIIGTVDGVDFVDDSLSTNVLPTLAAIAAFAGRRVAVLAGGADRGIDYAPLAAGLQDRTDPVLVLTLFDSGTRIAAALAADPPPAVETAAVEDFDDAVRRAYEWARPDGVVLLSPAAPSFGRFENYRHRARVFAEAMATCRRFS